MQKVTKLASVFVACLLLAMPALAADKPDMKTNAEIKALLEAHAKAFEKKDLKAVLAMYAPGPDTILIGNSPGQRWVGIDAIKKSQEAFFKTFDSETIKYTWLKIGSRGNVGWFAALCQITSYFQADKAEFPIVWSGMVEKEGGKWLFTLSHFSSLDFPEDYGMEFEEDVTEYRGN